MKGIISIFISLISFNIANAQFFEDNKFYSTIEMNLGNYIGFDLNLNLVQNETFSYKIGYNRHFQKPRSQPENFSPGFIGLFFLGLGSPYDQIENYQIGIGKIYQLNKSGTIRANISIGLGYSTIKETVNWVPNDDGIIGTNYSWDYNENYTVSLIINSKIEFLIKNWAGLTVSPMLLVNTERIYFGIGLGTMIGYLK